MSPGYLTAERLLALRDALTDRDWEILASLQTVKVATAHQLERLHFRQEGSEVTGARHRRRVLARLDELQVLTRLDRRIGGVRAGSSGFVYGVGLAGQRLLNSFVADASLRPRRPWTPGISFLAHRLAITELFVRLTEAQRTGVCLVEEFVAEPDCWRSFSGRGGARLLLKPDGFVRLSAREYEYLWFVEVDRGSESRPTLLAKCQRYLEYWLSGREGSRSSVFPAVMWLVPDIRRADLLTGVIERLPVDGRRLFQVGRFDEAVELLRGGDHAAA